MAWQFGESSKRRAKCRQGQSLQLLGVLAHFAQLRLMRIAGITKAFSNLFPCMRGMDEEGVEETSIGAEAM